MFLKFAQFLPNSLEPRYVSVRSEEIKYFYLKRTGDLFCTCIGLSNTDFEVTEDYNDVEKMLLQAEVKDRMGT